MHILIYEAEFIEQHDTRLASQWVSQISVRKNESFDPHVTHPEANKERYTHLHESKRAGECEQRLPFQHVD